MQTTTTQFTARAKGSIRKLTWRALISFEKNFSALIDFFTIGVSLIGGDDLIKGDGNVVQEWDKYDYADYSNRIMSIEITRQEDQISSAALSFADIKLDNHDDYFTPGGGSTIDNFILPYRPIKLFMGFGEESIAQFVGLTEKMPELQEKSKQASLHCIDFLSSLYNRSLDESAIFINYRTDQVLEEIMAMIGISATQYSFDTGFNIIPVTYFKKGDKVGDTIQRLMQAEMGRFFLDELGEIRFKNRQDYSSAIVYHFASNNILDVNTPNRDSIKNVVEVISDVREVQANQKVWELSSGVLVPPGVAVDIWAEFTDPVTTLDNPLEILSATTSYFRANTKVDGTGSAIVSDVTLDSYSLFSTSYKMTFLNSGVIDAYVTEIGLFGTPYRVVKQIYVREQDDTSVGKYDEQVLTIQNDYIQNESDATSLALRILADNAEYATVKEVEVKGSPALQIGDLVECSIAGVIDTYTIIKIVNRLANAKFTQILTVKKFDILSYFTVGISLIGGSDVIAP